MPIAYFITFAFYIFMTVTIDKHSGFCTGVKSAIEIAERELREKGSLYCLGEIVHNHEEVKRLKELGLTIIGIEQFETLRNCRVMIRAHGEPPVTYRIAKENNIELIDASCPIVLSLQKAIRMEFNEMKERKGQIVIYGKEGHPEVLGLIGQTDGTAIVIKGEDDFSKIDFSRPIRLFSQTTMSLDGFRETVKLMGEKMQDGDHKDLPVFKVKDSVCRQVSNRSSGIRKFAGKFDVIIFISGKNSSNGMILFEECRKSNPCSYFISGKEELQKKWFELVGSVGICGATSTPLWQMEEVEREIKRFFN